MRRMRGRQDPLHYVIFGTLLLVLVGPLIVAGALSTETLACDRARGTCVLGRFDPFRGARSRTVRLADVVKIELREVRRKGPPRAETLLISEIGATVAVAEGPFEWARAQHARLQAFFGGTGAIVEVTEKGNPVLAIAGVAVALVGAGVLVTGIRRWHRAPRGARSGPVVPRSLPPWLRKAAPIAAVLVLIAVGTLLYARTYQAGLLLHCDRLCELDGGQCPAGGTLELLTSPGPRVLRIWNPAAPGGWSERTVTLVAGETTELRCALP